MPPRDVDVADVGGIVFVQVQVGLEEGRARSHYQGLEDCNVGSVLWRAPGAGLQEEGEQTKLVGVVSE